MAVAIYGRVSTEEQRERQSIATQKEFGARYGQLHQLAVYECYADDGVSGTVLLDQRPAGRRIPNICSKTFRSRSYDGNSARLKSFSGNASSSCTCF